MTKQEILSTLDNEIDNPRLSHIMGVRNFNEMYTDSLLIEFIWNDSNDRQDLQDIEVTHDRSDTDEPIVYADDLNDDQIIRILEAAHLEEFASDMEVSIFIGD